MKSFFPTAQANNITLLPSEDNSTFSHLIEKIQSGNIRLADIPDFLSFFIETALAAAGVIAFLMILVGGYQYIIGGVYSEKREQGKTTLIYAIGGFILSLLAYAIVNLIQLAVTAI